MKGDNNNIIKTQTNHKLYERNIILDFNRVNNRECLQKNEIKKRKKDRNVEREY